MRDLQWFEIYSVVVTLNDISFTSEAFLVIGDVYLALFAMRFL